MTVRVPFLNLPEQHRALEAQLVAEFRDAVRSAAFINGEAVAQFEQAFAAYCGSDYAVGVSNGTDALKLALLGCGVQPGDKVVTAANTFVATVEAILDAGATPVLVDVDPQTCLMTAEGLQAGLAEHDAVSAVIPVHLYGQCVDVAALAPVCKAHDATIVEDAAQAHGAAYGEARAGSMGRAAAFSFYPGKNLGACGDAGAVTTNDTAIADRIRCLQDHGQVEKYRHAHVGYNHRMDAIQARFLSVKLPLLDEWNRQRQQAADWYRAKLAAIDAVKPVAVSAHASCVYHLFVIDVPDRDGLRAHLDRHGIQTGLHYPVPVHLQPAFANLGYSQGAFPVAEAWSARLLSLPMFPGLSEAQVEDVCACIADYF